MKFPRRGFSASGSGCRRAPGRLADCTGANLSGEAGARDRRVCPRWRGRHPCAADGSMAVGAARPTSHHRQPARCWRQYRHRSRRTSTTGRLHDSLDQSGEAINATLYEKLNYNFIRDIAPVASIVRQPLVMVVNPSVPAKTVPEFIAYAKANPGKINMASAGQRHHFPYGRRVVQDDGQRQHSARTLSRCRASTDRLLGGQVQMMFPATVASIEYIKAGKLRALAVTTATRSEVLPDIPTVGESVPGYEVSAWFGVGAPKATPAEIVDKLNKEINAGLADPKTKARFADLGGTVFALSPVDFGKLIADETEKWAKVVKFARHQAGVTRRSGNIFRNVPICEWRPNDRVGTFLPCQPRRAMSVIGGRPADICSMRVLRGFGRVEVWRGDFRSSISVAASFVWRCLSGSTMAPFPHPAHRTGHADFPHPALGQDVTPSPTTGHAQARSGVRARSARKGVGVDRSRPCVA